MNTFNNNKISNGVKKIIFLIMLGLGLILPNCQTTPARETPKTLEESFMEKYVLAESLELGIQPVFPLHKNSNIDNTEWFNLTMTHMINRDTAMRNVLGYLAYDVLDKNIDIGRVRQGFFRSTISQNLAQESLFNPYIGAGINYYRALSEESRWSNQRIWIHQNHTWGFHLATGLRYLSERSLSFSIDIYRDWIRNDFTVHRAQKGSGSEGSRRIPGQDVDLSMWTMGFNISLRF